jgi:uroporphyrinogen-III synthase
MKGEFEVRVALERLPLSRSSAKALRHLERYDTLVFTSKNAEAFFKKELRRKVPAHLRVIRVGPRNDLLKFDFKGTHILFPRSELAPSDIVRKLRRKGAVVRVVLLYVPKVAPLSRSQREQLSSGATEQLYFKSPSGIHGLLRQFRGVRRAAILSIRARCIGETTAAAARKAGFKRVFIR